MQSKRSNNKKERKDETKIKSLATMISEVHLQGYDKKEAHLQGMKLKIKIEINNK